MPLSDPPARLSAGYTLLQLLMAIALLSILAALALPAFQALRDRVACDSARLHLLSAFASARSTALSRRQSVSVCASSDGRHCIQDWSAGWMIYLDPDRQGQPGQQADVLHHQSNTRSSGVRAISSDGRRSLRYAADGRSLGSNLTVTICARGLRHGQVIVNNSGRARSVREADPPPCY